MFSAIENNTVGAVIAPEGKEDVPKEQRSDAWRFIIKPLVDEVAYGKPLPKDDCKKVVEAMMRFLEIGNVNFFGELHRKDSEWGKTE